MVRLFRLNTLLTNYNEKIIEANAIKVANKPHEIEFQLLEGAIVDLNALYILTRGIVLAKPEEAFEEEHRLLGHVTEAKENLDKVMADIELKIKKNTQKSMLKALIVIVLLVLALASGLLSPK